MRRFVLLILFVVEGTASPYGDMVKPFLRTHCASCHGAKLHAGGFSVEPFLQASEPAALRERAQWELIAQRIQSGEMPPNGAPKPEREKVLAVARWIDSAYDRIDRAQPADPGRVTAHRLNRFEYSNSVRDLLGLDMNPGAELPVDPYGYGFDNIGDVLSMNASLTEQYLKAAERIAQAAVPVPGESLTPVMQRYLAERIGQDRQLHVRVDHAFPADGEYMLRTGFYQGLRDGTRVQLRLYVDGREVASDVLKIHYQIDRGLEAHGVRIAAGKHRLEAAIEVLPEPPYKGALPYVEYVQVYGPMKVTPAAETTPYKRFFTCGHAPGKHEAQCARRILEPLASRAWRRPVTGVELDGLLGLAHREQSRTGSFEMAMRTSLEAILVSPHFLFRVERDRRKGVQPLEAHELASRLSYFLWSSLPDAELSRLADAGTLSGALREQTKRMLADKRSAALVESFTGQWLQTRNLSVLKPDPVKFKEFTGELADDMRIETEMFFAAVMQEDRPILDFLNAPFTFLNERLARHYGIPGIAGDRFRRVELDGVQRGGVLTQASVLTVSSYPTRTSPVIRGKWVLENILNQPPPPPPPGVPALDEKAGPNAGSMRQQLEKHRANVVCAGCHARMDPLGFGLENYDAIGRWRTTDAGVGIDPSGVLPGGEKFSSPQELKKILRSQQDVFTRALAEKMLTYAVGRGMEAGDRGTVRTVAGRVSDHGYRFSELILAVVESEPFRMRKSLIKSEGQP